MNKWMLVLFSVSSLAIAEDCPQAIPGLQQLDPASWGFDLENTRLQPRSSINVDNAARLELKWAYGFSNKTPRSFPLVSEDSIFIGDSGLGLVALDRETGCVRWVAEESEVIASAVLHRRHDKGVTLFYAARNTGIVALAADSGKRLWMAKTKDNPVAMYSGTPLVYQEDIFVPVSSQEVGLAVNPFYGCCETSGGMASIGAATGEMNWYTRTIPGEPQITGRRMLFIETHGPSGAPVWGAPTLDRQRGLVFFGTGQNYSHPTTDTSDAIFAVSATDGSVRWVHQFTANDAYNVACGINANCPDPMGPDLDFGAPPVLATLPDGRNILLAGQKSGDVYAMDPDTGKLMWQRKLGRGGALGGIHWGLAVNNRRSLLFVPISDVDAGALTGAGDARPGLYALDVETGETRWFYERRSRCPERYCWGGISGAISANDDLVFIGSIDGKLEAVSAATGDVLWSFDAWREYETVNGVPAKGGAFDAHGPMLIDDLLIVSAGYESFSQVGGNAFLVFQVRAEP